MLYTSLDIVLNMSKGLGPLDKTYNSDILIVGFWASLVAKQKFASFGELMNNYHKVKNIYSCWIKKEYSC